MAETGNAQNLDLIYLEYDCNLFSQAFPVAEMAAVGAAFRKYSVDSAIMSTVILDLQPFNQVNR